MIWPETSFAREAKARENTPAAADARVIDPHITTFPQQQLKHLANQDFVCESITHIPPLSICRSHGHGAGPGGEPSPVSRTRRAELPYLEAGLARAAW